MVFRHECCGANPTRRFAFSFAEKFPYVVRERSGDIGRSVGGRRSLQLRQWPIDVRRGKNFVERVHVLELGVRVVGGGTTSHLRVATAGRRQLTSTFARVRGLS
jgi:hypothetical protein